MQTHLTVSWGISRGRDTYGYNIARLVDDATGKRYRCMGGGYDMQGTVFAEWLCDVEQERLLAIKDRAGSTYTRSTNTRTSEYEDRTRDSLYGMTYFVDENRVSVDGACGLSSVEAIAKAAGLHVRELYQRTGRSRPLIGFLVSTEPFTD